MRDREGQMNNTILLICQELKCKSRALIYKLYRKKRERRRRDSAEKHREEAQTEVSSFKSKHNMEHSPGSNGALSLSAVKTATGKCNKQAARDVHGSLATPLIGRLARWAAPSMGIK